MLLDGEIRELVDKERPQYFSVDAKHELYSFFLTGSGNAAFYFPGMWGTLHCNSLLKTTCKSDCRNYQSFMHNSVR